MGASESKRTMVNDNKPVKKPEQDYKYERLADLSLIMIRSPKEIEKLILSDKIDKSELIKYSWMGLNILHLTDIYIAIASDCKRKTKNGLIDSLIKLRSTLKKIMPNIILQNTKTKLYFSEEYNVPCAHKEHCFEIPLEYISISRNSYGREIENKYKFTMLTGDAITCSYRSTAASKFIINPNISRDDFLIHLLATFPDFIMDHEYDTSDSSQSINANAPIYGPSPNIGPPGGQPVQVEGQHIEGH